MVASSTLAGAQALHLSKRGGRRAAVTALTMSAIPAALLFLGGCAIRDRGLAGTGIDDPVAIRMRHSDAVLEQAASLLLPGMDGYLLQRSDCWSEPTRVARAACNRGIGAAYEELSVLVSVLPTDWSDSSQSRWPEVGRMGRFIIRESNEGEGWSAFVGDRTLITATSRRLLEECLLRVAGNPAANDRDRSPPPLHEGDNRIAIWVTRHLGKSDVSISATWDNGSGVVSVVIGGDRRQQVASKFTTELKSVVTEEAETWLRLAIPADMDQGALHPFIVMEGLFGQWPVQ